MLAPAGTTGDPSTRTAVVGFLEDGELDELLTVVVERFVYRHPPATPAGAVR
jgi:hypothetical protein